MERWPEVWNPWQAEYKLGLRLKRDTAAFFHGWQRRAALQASHRQILGASMARLISRTLAVALQQWRERAQWQVLHPSPFSRPRILTPALSLDPAMLQSSPPLQVAAQGLIGTDALWLPAGRCSSGERKTLASAASWRTACVCSRTT